MGQRLTDRMVLALAAPASGNRIFYDAPDRKGAGLTPGFGVRITAAGSRAFVLNYRTLTGRERRLTIGSPPAWSLAAARAAAAEHRHRIDAGDDPLADLTAGREAPTMRDLAERFEREHLPSRRPSTARDYRALIANEILPKLGSLKVAAITYSDVTSLHRKMSERAPYSANRLLAVLSKMFALAVRWRMRADNPIKGVPRNDEQKRARYLSASELSALLSALDQSEDQQAANIFKLLLLTGSRRGEALTATWDQLDLETGVWIRPSAHTKQKKEHRVPLSGVAVKLLKEIAAEAKSESEFVFPSRTGGPRVDVKKNWAQVCKGAGIAGLRMHDLRHSYASMLVNSGLSLPVVGALLGHSNPTTTNRYAHLADDPLRVATERVGKLVTDARPRGGRVLKLPGA
jgi:integrase